MNMVSKKSWWKIQWRKRKHRMQHEIMFQRFLYRVSIYSCFLLVNGISRDSEEIRGFAPGNVAPVSGPQKMMFPTNTISTCWNIVNPDFKLTVIALEFFCQVAECSAMTKTHLIWRLISLTLMSAQSWREISSFRAPVHSFNNYITTLKVNSIKYTKI